MFRPPSKLAIGLAVLASAGMASVAVAPSASAFTFTGGSVVIDEKDINQSFTISFDGNIEGQDIAGLTSQANFKFLGFSGTGTATEAQFEIALTNTSSGGIISRTSALGFDINQTVKSATSSGLFSSTVLGGSLPNQFGSIGVCFTSGTTCDGQPNTGVDNDLRSKLAQTGTLTAKIALNGSVNQVALSNFGVRYQSVKIDGSAAPSGTGKMIVPPSPEKKAIPEPGTASALLVTAVAMLHCRRKKQAAAHQS